MLSISAAYHYYVYRGITDFRCGMDSLSGIVRKELKRDPLGGDIYIFFNRRRNQIKLLHFEGDGFALYQKRLERGSYELPSSGEQDSISLSSEALLLILRGIRLESVRRRKRYSLPVGS